MGKAPSHTALMPEQHYQPVVVEEEVPNTVVGISPATSQYGNQYSQEKQKVAAHHKLRYCHKTDWFLELVSAVLSVLCLLGMVILLARIQDRPLASWSSTVSPNAFLSVLSTASKACLFLPVSECISQLKWLHILQSKKANRLEDLQAFDNASRGSLGSLKFVFQRPTKSLLPYLGCAVIMAAIATDPMTQQILKFEQQLTQIPLVYSVVTTSQQYDFGNEGGSASDGSYFQLPRDTPMLSAVTVALYDQVRLPELTCPGSICNYPAFTSIGISSQCQNVTSLTTANCTGKSVEQQQCNFITPSGMSLHAETSFSAHWGFTHTRTNTTFNTSGPADNILTLGILRLPSDGDADAWQDGMEVYECAFKLCAMEYTGWHVVNGTIAPGMETPYAVNLTTIPGGYTVTDPDFAYNNSFQLNPLDFTNMRNILKDALAPSEAGTVNLNAPLYTSANIPGTLANVSSAMSYRMLSGPQAVQTRVPAYDDQTFITVRWPWIILPAILVLATCVFLLVVVYLTHRAGQLIWKSSLTPILLSETSWPLSKAGQRPLWTTSQLRARTAVIASHLTQ